MVEIASRPPAGAKNATCARHPSPEGRKRTHSDVNSCVLCKARRFFFVKFVYTRFNTDTMQPAPRLQRHVRGGVQALRGGVVFKRTHRLWTLMYKRVVTFRVERFGGNGIGTG